jgi:hypothetical protein
MDLAPVRHPEPRPTRERSGLLQLRQTEHPAKVRPRSLLSAERHGELHVVQTIQHRASSPTIFL